MWHQKPVIRQRESWKFRTFLAKIKDICRVMEPLHPWSSCWFGIGQSFVDVITEIHLPLLPSVTSEGQDCHKFPLGSNQSIQGQIHTTLEWSSHATRADSTPGSGSSFDSEDLWSTHGWKEDTLWSRPSNTWWDCDGQLRFYLIQMSLGINIFKWCSHRSWPPQGEPHGLAWRVEG